MFARLIAGAITLMFFTWRVRQHGDGHDCCCCRPLPLVSYGERAGLAVHLPRS
jgi:hypothetical protein